MPKSRKQRRPDLEAELNALAPAAREPSSPESQALLRAALRTSRSFVAAKAAEVIRDHLLPGFEVDLKAAFERFRSDPVKSDPGCKAKLAALEALDFLEDLDAAPFVAAARHFQPEPAWGPPVDTATGLRARGALGLARQGHVDFPLLMAELLSDPEAPVRQAAAEAVAHRAEPAGAGLLLLKLRFGDADPQVLLACISGLLALAPEWGLAAASAHLEGEDEAMREVAALALGQSRRADALEHLLEALSSELLARRRAPLFRALGLHRSDRALEALLEVIREGERADAKAAVESLAHRGFEPGLEERVRAAAAQNPEADPLAEALRSAFQKRP